MLAETVVCKECGGEVLFEESDVRGLGFKINVRCLSKCQKKKINSCPGIGLQSNAYEVNYRSVLALRLLGHGLTGLQTLCHLMDLPSPVTQGSYQNIVQNLKNAATKVAEESMTRAVEEEIKLTGTRRLYVSGDGSWRTQGFSSRQGVGGVAGIKTGKILDVEEKISYCKECDLWEAKCGTEEYLEWLEDHQHKCEANHEGSAGKMEVDAIVKIFQRSEAKYSAQYEYYIGDGDCKTYKSVSESNPYPNVQVKKKECVGHVSKRFGTQVRKEKDKLKGKKLKDGKGLTGQGRLIGKVIDKLQQYYGNAIRENKDNVDDMYKAIWATYFHYVSTDDKPQHRFCSPSWCKWQQAKEEGKLDSFVHKNKVPVVCMEAIKCVYERLTSRELLERCLGGFTQNSNESFNNNIWTILTKRTFSGMAILQLGVKLAVIKFNDGAAGVLDVLEEVGCKLGSNSINGALKQDNKRINDSERKSLQATLEVRRKKRRQRIQDQEDNERAEGAVYAAGAH